MDDYVELDDPDDLWTVGDLITALQKVPPESPVLLPWVYCEHARGVVPPLWARVVGVRARLNRADDEEPAAACVYIEHSAMED